MDFSKSGLLTIESNGKKYIEIPDFGKKGLGSIGMNGMNGQGPIIPGINNINDIAPGGGLPNNILGIDPNNMNNMNNMHNMNDKKETFEMINNLINQQQKDGSNIITNADNSNTDNSNANKQLSEEEIALKVSSAHKIVITYGQNCCQSAKKRMCETALNAGKADECFAYDASVMDDKFTKKNSHILKQGRGAGYWLWKPYIIYKHLTDDNLPDGSYIAYSDAGAKLVGDVAHVLKFMEENDSFYKGVLFFGVGFDQKNFCKRDAFILQNCDYEECYNAMQINAFVGFFRKCDYSRMVVKTWLDECQDERILTDMANTQGKPNLSGFRDHRHDQAAITNVMVSHGWNYDTTNGPVLDKVFYHDRFKG